MPPMEKIRSQRPTISPRRIRGQPQGQASGLQRSQIARAEAQQGKGGSGQRGNDEFAWKAVRPSLAGIGIDDFGQEMVFGKMEAVAVGAAKGQTGPQHLGDAISRTDAYLQTSGNFGPQSGRQRFGNQKGAFEIKICAYQPHGIHDRH